MSTEVTSDEQRVDAHGRFVWYDLMTGDAAGSVGFYTDLLPWQTVAMDMGEAGDYTMWTLTGDQDGSIGGLGPLPGEGVPPHWMAHVFVTDVDATAARAAELGGTLHVPPTDIPGIGRYAAIGDPQGGSIGIYTSANPPGPIAQPKVGAFSWHELGTSDLDGALAFYGELFGWKELATHDMGEMGPYRIYGQGDVPYGGMFTRPPQMPVTMWIYYVRVDDVEASCEAVKAAGGQVINGPMDVPGGDRVAQCIDPQGAMFALHQHNG